MLLHLFMYHPRSQEMFGAKRAAEFHIIHKINFYYLARVASQ